MDHPTTTNQNANPTRAEAERLLGIAEKLLHTRDLTGSREFALLAQETEPLLEGSDQILAITDVLLASERRVNNNRHQDWYAILQTDHRSDPDILKKNYRRLALLLHPDKNNYPFSDAAFQLVADAWAVLSDPSKRAPYDHDLSLFSKVDLRHQQPPLDKDKLPVRRRSPRADSSPASSFWTACPYCYVLYEYPRVYEECCLRCQNCERAFHAAPIASLPPMVPGKEAYYCCWGFFPLGFTLEEGGNNKNTSKGKKKVAENHNTNNNNNNNVNNSNNNTNSGFPNWMPGMFTTPVGGGPNMNMNMNMPYVNVNASAGGGSVDMSDGSASAGFGNNTNVPAGYANAAPRGTGVPGPRKRGRPRKNPFPV